MATAWRWKIARADNSREQELRRLNAPLFTGKAFQVEDIIDPRETNARFVRFIEAARSRTEPPRASLGRTYKAAVRT